MGLDGLLPHKEHFMDGGNRVCSLSVSSSGGGLWRCNGSGAGNCFSWYTFHVEKIRLSSKFVSILDWSSSFSASFGISFFSLYFVMYSSRSKPHSFSMLLISLVRKLSGKDLYNLFSSPVPLDALIKRAILFRLIVMEGGGVFRGLGDYI